jgi:hypothetical protein
MLISRPKLVTLIVFFLFLEFGFAQTSNLSPLLPRYNAEKKLVWWDWNSPSHEDLLRPSTMSILSTMPFQGIVFDPGFSKENGEYRSIFSTNPFSKADLDKITSLKNIKWSSNLTDNFLWIRACGTYKQCASNSGFNGYCMIDLFNSSEFDIAIKNATKLANAVVASGAKGLMLDTEDYTDFAKGSVHDKNHIWKYDEILHPSTGSKGHSKVVVRDQYFIFGRKFMAALADVKPDITVMTSGAWSFSSYDMNRYELLKDFCDGMMEEAFARGQGATVVDGNEIAYTHTSTLDWVYEDKTQPRAYKKISENLEMGNIDHSHSNMQVAHGIYDRPYAGTNDPFKYDAIEANVYQALLNSDEYAWYYTEEPKSENYWQNASFPEKIKTSILSAQEKIKTLNSLGFSINQNIEKRNNQNYYTFEKITPNATDLIDLKIISPKQNQTYAYGETINFQVTDPKSHPFVVYVINYEGTYAESSNTTKIATTPGNYIVYAFTNHTDPITKKNRFLLSNVVTFKVK